jgi:hypothetical protein
VWEETMIQAPPQSEIQMLEERLSRGAELLFDMEQRGDLGADYERWLAHYTELLARYTSLQAA